MAIALVDVEGQRDRPAPSSGRALGKAGACALLWYSDAAVPMFENEGHTLGVVGGVLDAVSEGGWRSLFWGKEPSRSAWCRRSEFGGAKAKEATTLLAPGDKAPDFELESTAGRKVRIGLITPLWCVLLIFFRSGCEACRLLVPHLASLQRNYGDADIEILGVSQDGKLRTADFVDTVKWRGRVLLDHPALEASRAYEIETLPSGILIGTDMRIRAVADATDLESFERLAEAVASEVGWSYKPVLPPELRAATVPPCPSKSAADDRTTGAA